jgi:predicted ATPase/DNA-binding SARP family transcriptional activator
MGASAANNQPSIRAYLLGHVRILVGERELPLHGWRRRSARSLLLLLLTTPGHRLPRDRVLDLLWPNSAATSSCLRPTIHALRRALEPDLLDGRASAYVEVGSDSVRLRGGPGLWIDVAAFESALSDAQNGPTVEHRSRLRAAIGLYRGELLASELDVDWAEARREELRAAWQSAVLSLTELEIGAGEPLLAVPSLRRLLAADRTTESAHRALMRAYVAAGQTGDALRQYHRCVGALAEELDVTPSEATERLYSEIRTTSRDRLRTTSQLPDQRLDSLPVPPTPLVGRERTITVSQELLWRRDVRLVTLTGPGGIGKTHLALEIAASLADDFDDGIGFVSLGSIRRPKLVARAIADVIGATNTGSRSLLACLRENLGGREVLLVLDNCEHVLEATGSLVATLLETCPRLKVLATSREPLRLRSEQIVTVPPLTMPPTEHGRSASALLRYEAAALFIDRARAVTSDFALSETNAPIIADICERLDGLPLAIELAAARIRHLDPATMLSRLDTRLAVLTDGPRDLPARQRTMRDAIVWSHDLLTPCEQALFRRLAVFVGGCTLEAAIAVCDPDADLGVDIQRGVEALADKSLLRREEGTNGEPRFSMLETIREFGLEQLEASGEAETIQRRRLTFYLTLAENLSPPLAWTGMATGLRQLDLELPNVRAALDWALSHGETEMALRLIVATSALWSTRADPGDGRRWLETALSSEQPVAPFTRVNALIFAAGLAALQGDYRPAVASAQEALALAQAHGYPFGEAAALTYLAATAEWQGNLARATRLYEQAIRITRELDNLFWLALLHTNLGDVAVWQGDLAGARSYAADGLALWREQENSWGLALGLGTAAAVAGAEGDQSQATSLYAQGLSLWQELGDRRGIAGNLAGLAGVAQESGEPERAARLLGAARALCDTTGVHCLAHHIQYERVLAATRTLLKEDTFHAAWQAGQAMREEQAIAEAGALAPHCTRLHFSW